MKFFKRLARIVRDTADVIERPYLLLLRHKGVPKSLAVSLDRSWLRDLRFRTIVDVGANTGQFAIAAHNIFPQARIYSFEPLHDVYKELVRRTASLSGIQTFNLALGEEAGTITFWRNEFTPSSSVLMMAEAHRQAFPYTSTSQAVEVRIERLDTIAETLTMESELLLKIDVQGYEDRVLRGATRTVERAAMLLIEISFETLYEGQASHDEIARFARTHGFEYAGALDQLLCPRTGRILSADGIFLRKP
jgi:FkbM family methyltransferase